MSIDIEKDEDTATLRRVPCRIFTSNGTGPDTGAQGDAVIMAVNSITTISLSSALTAIHASMGMYQAQLTASEVSILGTHPLYHIAGDFPQHIATIQVKNHNHFSTLSALNISSLTALGVTRLDSSVTLRAVVHSGATIKGIENYANISNVTLHAGTHSSVTIQGVSRLNSAVTLNADTHSGATIQGLTRVLSLSANDDKTGYGLADGAITSAKFGAGAIDAVALATDAGQEIADRLIARNIAGSSDGGRTIGQALAPLRNRSAIDGSTLTVFDVDDATSLWTASVTTGSFPLTGIDPLGP